nr:cyclic peptide export ABC transporter [Pseudoalteromonas sp. S16_S37]
MESLNRLYKKYFWYFAFTLPMGILLGVISMHVLQIINDALTSGVETIEYSAQQFFITIGVLLGLGVLNEFVKIRLVVNASRDIHSRLVDKVLDSSYEKVESIGLPKVNATLSKDVDTAIKFFQVLPQMVANVSIIVCAIAYMAYLSLTALMYVFALIAFAGLSFTVIILLSRKYLQNIRECADTLMEHYEAIVKGKKELSLDSKRQRYVRTDIRGTLEKLRKNNRGALTLFGMLEHWGQFILFAILGVILYYLGMTLGLEKTVVVGYILTLLFILEPIEQVTQASTDLMEAKVAFKKIESLELSDEVVDEKQEVAALGSNLNLQLSNITYQYAAQVESEKGFKIGPIDCEFKAGEATFIIGGNGSGKSTLFKMLAGLYNPTDGTIEYGDIPVDINNIASYRECVSLIAADFWVFKHILVNDSTEDEKLLQQLVSLLKLDKAVEIIEGKWSKTTLSQGQRKRLALIQSYIEHKPIVLLDEWAADQDPVFKKVFYEEIVPSLKAQGKVVIIVSHDDNYYHTADRLMELRDGQLILHKNNKPAEITQNNQFFKVLDSCKE